MTQIQFYEAKLAYEIDSWDLSEMLKAEEAIIVIDTRSSEAYTQEHIPGALHFPHRTMAQESTLSLDRSLTYITYCDGIGCNASTKGALKLSRLGFTAKELLGGLDWWKRDGHATDGTQGSKASTISCGC